MLYTVYKVVNLLTQEFYIGVHKTDDPHDDYLGSGKLIQAQVALHGRTNFSKEILATFQKRRDAYNLEAQLVNPLLGTPGCLNLHPGGYGGFGYINRSGLGLLGSRMGNAALKARAQADPEFCERRRQDALYALTRAKKALVGRVFRGWHHSEETKATMALNKRGVGNAAFGHVWVFNPETSEALLASQTDAEALLAKGWVRGRGVRKSPYPRKHRSQAQPPCPNCGERVVRCGRGHVGGRRPLCACIRREAVQRYREGCSPAQVAQEFGIGPSTLFLWVSRAS